MCQCILNLNDLILYQHSFCESKAYLQSSPSCISYSRQLTEVAPSDTQAGTVAHIGTQGGTVVAHIGTQWYSGGTPLHLPLRRLT